MKTIKTIESYYLIQSFTSNTLLISCAKIRLFSHTAMDFDWCCSENKGFLDLNQGLCACTVLNVIIEFVVDCRKKRL